MEIASTATITPLRQGRLKPRAGLVLTGGGARAAYQVGVVKAVRDLLGNPTKNPFPILSAPRPAPSTPARSPCSPTTSRAR